MRPLPAWTTAEWTSDINEPFRSDGEFWAGLAASTDALVSLAAAVAVSVLLALTGHPLWALLPFVVPAALAIRAALLSASSSRRSREGFSDPREWRDAERTAVATAFIRVARRPRRRPH